MKKAQVKMGENIAVMLLFTVLLVIGVVFYMQYQRGALKEDMRRQRIMEAIEISQRIAYLPEVQCSEDGIQKENCYDGVKIEKAAQVISENKNYYYGILGYSTVEVELLYPDILKIPLYNNKPAKKIMSEEMTQVPIAVYLPDKDRYVFGVLKVVVYG